ncbi:MarR family winged helix-turn-helix transcriptional regulator [Holdemanella biformis]|jgi:DNA-binding MarR family transcriptional regulator|uniref:MarR family winged helix-turn-helix transcriptional regulator n=1 Tax=Holdemanella biformis TaxID=1735 RepID=UPI0025E6DDE9|nr:MarR family transcriptional regulator [Holdemanella biformis]
MLTIEEFLRLSNRLREYYGKQIKDRFAEYTFSPNEISILILLQNNNSITTSTQLRVVLGVSKALVSRSVTSLEQKGIVLVKPDPNDKRISHIELTENAIPVLEKISIEIEKINQVLFKDIPTKDIQCMIDTMNKMNKKIEGVN